QELERQLKAKTYDGQPVRVLIDDRDLRGGEKTWHHIKRGVPLRAEIGPRDVAAGSVFLARRDQGPKEKSGIPREELVATIDVLLNDIQTSLYQKALAMQQENTREFDSLDELTRYFTKK